MRKVLLGVYNLFHRIISFVSQYYRFILTNQVIPYRRQVCHVVGIQFFLDGKKFWV